MEDAKDLATAPTVNADSPDAFARTVMHGLESPSGTGESRSEGSAVPHGGARYAVGAIIGEGGMGRVLEANDRQFSRVVAVKQLRRELAASPAGAGARERFALEALVTGNLEHSGVPTVYERGQLADGSPFYAMHLVKGLTLSQLISDAPTLEARLKLVPIVIKVAQTLGYAHERGVVHRDVKPDNVIVGRYGEAVVLDWGIAKVRGIPTTSTASGASGSLGSGGGSSSRTSHGSIVGTPAYMAPEQASGHVDLVDERTDVFALGALLYQLLTGHAPYAGATAQAVIARAAKADFEPLAKEAPSAPAGLRAICEKAMARDARDRHRTAADVAEALESHVAAAIAGKESGAVKWFVNVAIAFGVAIVSAAAITTWFAVSQLREQGTLGLLVVVVVVIAAALSFVELRTRGRYKLAPVMLAFALATLCLGIATTFAGVNVVLKFAMKPEIVSDAAKYRELVTQGMQEAVGALAGAAVMSALQLIVWGVARRRAELARK